MFSECLQCDRHGRRTGEKIRSRERFDEEARQNYGKHPLHRFGVREGEYGGKSKVKMLQKQTDGTLGMPMQYLRSLYRTKAFPVGFKLRGEETVVFAMPMKRRMDQGERCENVKKRGK